MVIGLLLSVGLPRIDSLARGKPKRCLSILIIFNKGDELVCEVVEVGGLPSEKSFKRLDMDLD